MNRILSLFLLFSLVAGCVTGIKNAPPVKTPGKDKDFPAFKSEGDRQFKKMHWVGWNRAIENYQKALSLRNDKELKKKLFFAFILKMFRENHLKIKVMTDIENARRLAMEPDLTGLQPYLKIAETLKVSERNAPLPSIDLESLRQNRDRDYLLFLYLSYVHRHLIQLYSGDKKGLQIYFEEKAGFSKQFPGSNLRFFLGNESPDTGELLAQDPDFMEMMLIEGEVAYAGGRLTAARKLFSRVLAYHPGVPDALTGLGSILLNYGLYREALGYYRQAIEINPAYYKPLFGKAVCLSRLGEYETSNITLDIILENRLLHQGEAFYYKAFNHYLLRHDEEVDLNIKSAETYIPYSLELNELAGVYYYQKGKLKKSRGYFKRALEIQKSNPDPYYYLGFVDLRENRAGTALKNFALGATYFMEMITNKKSRLAALEDKDLPAGLKAKIKCFREKDLRRSIDETLEKLEKIVTMFGKHKRKELEAVSEVIGKLKSETGNNPATK